MSAMVVTGEPLLSRRRTLRCADRPVVGLHEPVRAADLGDPTATSITGQEAA